MQQNEVMDSEHWITLENGEHALVDGEGNVIGGAGGNLSGKKFEHISSKSPDRSATKKEKSEPHQFSQEHRDKQRAAVAAAKSLSNKDLDKVAKERGVSIDEARRQLIVEANHDPDGNAERFARLGIGKEEPKEEHVTQSHANSEKPRARRVEAGEAPDTSGMKAPEGHEVLSEPLRIGIETEKAYGVQDPEWIGRGYYAQHRWAKGESVATQQYIWIPKSQVTTENGHIVSMPRWLAEKNSRVVSTHEGNARQAQREEKREAAFNAGTERYNTLLSQAKAGGVKGVRVGMRTSTIKEKMRAHGMAVDHDDIHDDGIDFMAGIVDEHYGMDESAREVDANGFIEIKDNPISKVGVFDYRGKSIPGADPDKMYKVYRPEEELNNQETIDSFKLLPWTDNHPDTLLGPAENDHRPPEEKGVDGVIGENVYYKNGVLFANIKTFSDKIKQLIQRGKIQLSAGYRCIYEHAPGVFNGQAYDYVQRRIRGNHLALVSQGRMGADVAVLDQSEVAAFDHLTFTFDAKDFDMGNENQEAVVAIKDAEPAAKPQTEPTQANPAPAENQQIAALNTKLDTLIAVVGKLLKMEQSEQSTVATGDACKSAGMDAADTARAISAEIAKKTALAEKLAPVVGVFDHSDMNLNDVAKYGAEKIGLKVESGTELSAITGYLAAYKPEKAIAFDAKEPSADWLTNQIKKGA